LSDKNVPASLDPLGGDALRRVPAPTKTLHTSRLSTRARRPTTGIIDTQ
jgi:hypothetical protein